jgi:hypothetical protein
MTFRQCVDALDTIAWYPALIGYIKTYDHPFACTVETDPHQQELANQLDTLLNKDQMHSGSWMYLIYILREVYRGNITYEELVDEMNNDEERRRLIRQEQQMHAKQMHAKQMQVKQMQALEQKEKNQPQAEQPQAEQPPSADDLYFQDRSRLC